MKLEGAIFDMDGTLFDSMHIWYKVSEDYLVSQGIEPPADFFKDFKPLTFVEVAEYFQRECGLDQPTEQILNGIYKMLHEFYLNDVQLKPGGLEFLEELRCRGVKMAIATANDKDMVSAALRRLGALDYFSKIYTCAIVGASKDVPLIYEEALRHLGTDIENTLVFEDALYAVETAKRGGFKVCAVDEDFEIGRQDVIRGLADYYITAYEQVWDFVD